MYLKLGLVFFAFLFHIVQCLEKGKISKACEEKGLKIENLLRSLLFINDRYKTFNTKEDIFPYCRDAKLLEQESKKFKKIPNCLTPVSAQALAIILPKFRNFHKLRCEVQTDLTFEVAKCAGETNRKQIHNCFEDYSKVLQFTANKVENADKQLSLLCCNYHRVLGCLGSDKLKDCGKLNTGKFAYDTLHSFLSDLFELMCNKHTKGYCEAEGLATELSNIKYKSSLSEFIIVPALNIAENLSKA